MSSYAREYELLKWSIFGPLGKTLARMHDKRMQRMDKCYNKCSSFRLL